MGFDRSAFLYLEPSNRTEGDPYQFAQCGTCQMWTGYHCAIHGRGVSVTEDMTCGFYMNGKPSVAGELLVKKLVTSKESGLERRQVRCENCRYYDHKKSICKLYKFINDGAGGEVKLNIHVHPQGCCNANMPM